MAPGWGIKPPLSEADAMVVFGNLYAGCWAYENGDWRAAGTLKLLGTDPGTFWDCSSETFGGSGLVEYGRKNPFGFGVGADRAAGAEATFVAGDDFGVDVKGWPIGDVKELFNEAPSGDPKWLKPDPSRDAVGCDNPFGG